MNENRVDWVMLAACSVVIILVGVFVGKITENDWKRQAIERGFGEYNRQSGAFQWRTNVAGF